MSDDKTLLFSRLLREQLDLLPHNVIALSDRTRPFIVHRIDPLTLIDLCQRVESIFSDEPTLLELSSPIVAVGDLHGHLGDLLRILSYFGVPSDSSSLKYLFLGDIVDRGEFSTETITLVYLLKAVFPMNVYIVRGNHEFESLSVANGFYRELVGTYISSSDVFKAFVSSFSYMPLAAIVDGLTVCVHGGIGPEIKDASSIATIERPIGMFTSGGVRALMWSDPSLEVEEFAESPRGCGFHFGEAPLLSFLNRSGAVRLLRAHECLREGFVSRFGDRLLSVFSASNYCGSSGNSGAAVMVMPDGMDSLKDFPPLPYLKRGDATIRRAGEEKIARKITATVSDPIRFYGRVGLSQGRQSGECIGKSPSPTLRQFRGSIRSQRSGPPILRDTQWAVIRMEKKG
jgi:protein phosphatase